MVDSLKARIQADRNSARLARNQLRLDAISLLLAAIKQREIDERKEWTDGEILALIEKMIKQRQESIKQYQAAKRVDLADKEQLEIDILQEYLPPPMSQDQVKQVIQEAIEKTGATSMRDMGKVIAHLKPQVQGRADMAKVSELVKQYFS